MGGRRGGGRGEGMQGNRAAPSFPKAKDLEKLNPAMLLVGKHKKLSLSDSQVAVLKALQLEIFERNGALMSRYDSVQQLYHPPSRQAVTAADDKAQGEAQAQMRLMRALLDSLIERRRADVGDAYAVIPEANKKTAAEFLDKQEQEFLELIPSSGAGGRGDERRGRPDGD
jgi:hypothetical protein